MTDEIKTEEKETKCLCQSKEFRKFLTIALGTFVGVYCALSLFAALHRPPMMPPNPMLFNKGMYGCPCHIYKHHHHFNRHGNPDFKKIQQKDIERKTPFERKTPDTDD